MTSNNTWEERKAWRAQFYNVRALRIAAHLTKLDPSATHWTVEKARDPYDDVAPNMLRIIGSGGEKLYVHLDDHKQRIEVSGGYGTMEDGSVWTEPQERRVPPPTMSAAKADDQIAADIVKRVLPHYRECLDLYRQQRDNQKAYMLRVQTLAARMIALSGGKLQMAPRQSSSLEVYLSFYKESDEGSYGTIRIYDDSVSFETLSGDRALAEAFAVMVGKL